MENFFRESGVLWLWEKIKTLLSAKQDKLVSGTNIKTINGTSLLGSGDVTISGGSGGNFNESGTYPNLTAGKATKLATARKIGLTGGAVGTATNFDGSTAINIPVTSLQENALAWSTNDIQNGTTIIDSIFRDTIGNRLAFCNPAAITIEHSQDGGNTWVSIDNDADKIKLVTPVLGDINFTIGGSETPPNRDVVQTRVTIDAITADLYFVVNKILIKTIGVTGVDSSAGKPTFCKIEYQTYANYGTGVWTTFKDIEVIGQPGWNSISTNELPNFGYANPPHIRLIRFTLYKPNGCGQYIGRLANIAFLALGISQGGNTFSKTGHIYGIDVNQNVTFPANLKANDFNGVNIAVNNNIKGKTLNIGTNTTLSNSGTAAIGQSCSATNPYAIAMGYQAVSSGYYSIAIGTNVEASANYQTVVGKNNATSNHAFVIGWGTADAKKNIFSVDTSGNVYGTKFITSGGTNQQVVLGDGSLKSLDELSPITDADADILLDNHIHSIDVNANGNDVNISVIESSKNGNTWETEDNDIPIPLATTTSAGVMSKEDKIKSDGLLIYYHLTEDEYNNHELVSLYPLVLAIKDALFDSSTNKWKYDDSKSYDVRVKGWTHQDNGITYLNVNVRLLTSQGGHSIGFSGFVDVDFVTETYFDADIPLYIGYICGKYHIENDGMTIVAPEDSGFYVEI